MTSLTTLRCHEDAIRAIVRADIYGGVTLRQMGGEPRDLQSIVASDAVPRTRIAQSNRARARQVTQRVPFDSIGLAAPIRRAPALAQGQIGAEHLSSFTSLISLDSRALLQRAAPVPSWSAEGQTDHWRPQWSLSAVWQSWTAMVHQHLPYSGEPLQILISDR